MVWTATDSTSWEFAMSTNVSSMKVMRKSAADAFHLERIPPHHLGVCPKHFRFMISNQENGIVRADMHPLSSFVYACVKVCVKAKLLARRTLFL